MYIKYKGERMQKDLKKENKSLKATLAELAHWELQLDSIKNDLQKIVDYLFEDEFKHYIESNKPDDHIFVAVNRVEKYLNLK